MRRTRRRHETARPRLNEDPEVIRAALELERELRAGLRPGAEPLGRTLMSVVDHEFVWWGVSDGLAEVLGRRRQALLGQPALEVVIDDARSPIRRGALQENGHVRDIAAILTPAGAQPCRYAAQAIHGGEFYVCVVGELLSPQHYYEAEIAPNHAPAPARVAAGELVTREQAAAALTVSLATVDRLRKVGTLVDVHVSPGRVGILRSSVEHLLLRGGPLLVFVVTLLMLFACWPVCLVDPDWLP